MYAGGGFRLTLLPDCCRCDLVDWRQAEGANVWGGSGVPAVLVTEMRMRKRTPVLESFIGLAWMRWLSGSAGLGVKRMVLDAGSRSGFLSGCEPRSGPLDTQEDMANWLTTRNLNGPLRTSHGGLRLLLLVAAPGVFFGGMEPSSSDMIWYDWVSGGLPPVILGA